MNHAHAAGREIESCNKGAEQLRLIGCVWPALHAVGNELCNM
jgi:hypothetical protein